MKYSVAACSVDEWIQYLCDPICFDDINKAYKYTSMNGSVYIRRVIEGTIKEMLVQPPKPTIEEKPG